MRKCKFVLGVVSFLLIYLMTSCLSGDNVQTFTNAFGYVDSDAGTTFVRTQNGHQIVWDGIKSASIKQGDCLLLSYSVDGTLNNKYSLAKDVTLGDRYSTAMLNYEKPINVNDSNFISRLAVSMYASDRWFGDNWRITFMTKNYEGLTVTPRFYCPTNLANFKPDTDSLFIDVRLAVSGKRTSDKVVTPINSCVVNLTQLRTLLGVDDKGKNISIFFRYYPEVSKKPELFGRTVLVPEKK